MANTDITLRLDKGSSLTFNEMDTNFSSFFYSASTHIVAGANKLRLFYTGSGQLDAPFNTVRYAELSLPTATTTSGGGTTDPAGSNRQIQFNDNGVFGASSQLQFLQSNDTGARLGVGMSPRTTLDIQSANSNQATILNLNASSNTTNTSAKAMISFRQGGSTFAQLGKRNQGNNIVDFYVKSQLNLGTHNYASGQAGDPIISKRKLKVVSDGIIVGDSLSDYITVPLSAPLNIIGDIGVGSDLSVANTSFIGASDVGSSLLPNSSVNNGLLIQSPKSTNGGHVIIGINTDSGEHESFSIVKGQAGSFDTQIATFGADGKVGIGNINPKEVLHVNGNITGSGNFSVNGTAHIKTTQTGLHTDKALVITDKGQVKEMVASPIPLGGIIMWSGTVNAIPTGWKFCDGNGGIDINGITIPDLRNRFIRSAASTFNSQDGLGINETGGSNTHDHGGSTEDTTLTVNQIPSHDHTYQDSYYIENGARNPAITGTIDVGSKIYGGSGDSDTDNDTLHYRNNDTDSKGGGQSHNHDIDSASNVPEYYTLAFIIYVGA